MGAALVGLAACGGEPEGERVELGGQEAAERPGARASWSPELTAQIDSANAAYADGDYETAAAMFTAITEEEPELGVAWFGLYMAESAMGNEEAAAEAMAKAEQYAPGLGRMHDAATDSTARVPMMMEGHPEGELPSGHPSMDSMMKAQEQSQGSGGS
jgi:tetratricopeptide (TPR) repeat protein